MFLLLLLPICMALGLSAKPSGEVKESETPQRKSTWYESNREKCMGQQKLDGHFSMLTKKEIKVRLNLAGGTLQLGAQSMQLEKADARLLFGRVSKDKWAWFMTGEHPGEPAELTVNFEGLTIHGSSLKGWLASWSTWLLRLRQENLKVTLRFLTQGFVERTEDGGFDYSETEFPVLVLKSEPFLIPDTAVKMLKWYLQPQTYVKKFVRWFVEDVLQMVKTVKDQFQTNPQEQFEGGTDAGTTTAEFESADGLDFEDDEDVFEDALNEEEYDRVSKLIEEDEAFERDVKRQVEMAAKHATKALGENNVDFSLSMHLKAQQRYPGAPIDAYLTIPNSSSYVSQTVTQSVVGNFPALVEGFKREIDRRKKEEPAKSGVPPESSWVREHSVERHEDDLSTLPSEDWDLWREEEEVGYSQTLVDRRDALFPKMDDTRGKNLYFSAELSVTKPPHKDVSAKLQGIQRGSSTQYIGTRNMHLRAGQDGTFLYPGTKTVWMPAEDIGMPHGIRLGENEGGGVGFWVYAVVPASPLANGAVIVSVETTKWPSTPTGPLAERPNLYADLIEGSPMATWRMPWPWMRWLVSEPNPSPCGNWENKARLMEPDGPADSGFASADIHHKNAKMNVKNLHLQNFRVPLEPETFWLLNLDIPDATMDWFQWHKQVVTEGHSRDTWRKRIDWEREPLARKKAPRKNYTTEIETFEELAKDRRKRAELPAEAANVFFTPPIIQVEPPHDPGVHQVGHARPQSRPRRPSLRTDPDGPGLTVPTTRRVHDWRADVHKKSDLHDTPLLELVPASPTSVKIPQTQQFRDDHLKVIDYSKDGRGRKSGLVHDGMRTVRPPSQDKTFLELSQQHTQKVKDKTKKDCLDKSKKTKKGCGCQGDPAGAKSELTSTPRSTRSSLIQKKDRLQNRRLEEDRVKYQRKSNETNAEEWVTMKQTGRESLRRSGNLDAKGTPPTEKIIQKTRSDVMWKAVGDAFTGQKVSSLVINRHKSAVPGTKDPPSSAAEADEMSPFSIETDDFSLFLTSPALQFEASQPIFGEFNKETLDFWWDTSKLAGMEGRPGKKEKFDGAVPLKFQRPLSSFMTRTRWTEFFTNFDGALRMTLQHLPGSLGYSDSSDAAAKGENAQMMSLSFAG
eukprot:Cvel_17261.t1-p1 / transcript=Cvel_17261.t1 / gene=Cvel_17261 / organism=Chromera_velia_CCMP2878 / gene_product=hypothetical protein / transcript_product=hypothetical protein / location=Cvel_scaffold1368:451-7980(-) / protein_length=1131 / sequence_SO=supercontig / SO=protein_coding / is_pseudo=false